MSSHCTDDRGARVDQLLADYDGLATELGSERELQRQMRARRGHGVRKAPRHGKRGRSYKWAIGKLEHLAGYLEKAARLDGQKISKRDAIERLKHLAAGRQNEREALLLDALVEYSKLRRSGPLGVHDDPMRDRMARAFRALGLLPTKK